MNEKEILKKHLKEIGKKGGQNSVKKRFEGKTKEEISEMMRGVARGLSTE